MIIKTKRLITLLKFMLLMASIGFFNLVQANLQEAEKRADNPSNKQAILRLEDTIRGNKEQPQVLNIVPWQLPVHQRIKDNAQWRLEVKKLPNIERNAFLRNLALRESLMTDDTDGLRQLEAALEAQTKDDDDLP